MILQNPTNKVEAAEKILDGLSNVQVLSIKCDQYDYYDLDQSPSKMRKEEEREPPVSRLGVVFNNLQ